MTIMATMQPGMSQPMLFSLFLKALLRAPFYGFVTPRTFFDEATHVKPYSAAPL